MKPVAQMIPVCQLVWDSSAFEHEICPNPRFDVLPRLVESIQKNGYHMNDDGVIQVTRLADKYLVITGRLRSIAATMCKVKEVPALVYPEGVSLGMMRYESVSPKGPPIMTFEEKLAYAKFMMKQGITHKELRKVFGYYMARKLIKQL